MGPVEIYYSGRLLEGGRMKTLSRSLLMLFLGLTICDFSATAQIQRLGAIEGRVIEDGTNKGIEGVEVKAMGPEGSYKSVSDAQGNYAITKLPEGLYRLSVDMEYAQRMKERPLRKSIEPGETAKNVNIVLAAMHNYDIEVSVVDTDGNPVEDVKLQMGQYHPYFDIWSCGKATGPSTNSKGLATLKIRDMAGKYVLIASKKRVGEGISNPFNLGEKDSAAKVKIKFYKGISVKGKVSDQKGKPIARARVTIRYADGRNIACSYLNNYSRTDENGEYEITGLGKGNRIITARCEGYAQAKKEISLSKSGSPKIVNFALTKGLSICGTVSDENGNAVHNARVSGRSGSGYKSVKTDQDGEYCLEDLRAGTYRLTVSKDGFDKVERKHLKAGTTDVDFILHGGV